MKLVNVLSITVLVWAAAACHTLKKTTVSEPPAKPVVATTPINTAPSPVMPFLAPRPTNGVFAPGNDELAAIQVKYKEVNMQTLNNGYAIYTGKCTNCHEAQNIYSRAEETWPAIINDMAQKAELTDAQKDAVSKYILAIKATQAK